MKALVAALLVATAGRADEPDGALMQRMAELARQMPELR